MDILISSTEYEELLRDARRYRWIEQQKGKSFEPIGSGIPWFECSLWKAGFYGREHLDNLIDKAVAEFPVGAE